MQLSRALKSAAAFQLESPCARRDDAYAAPVDCRYRKYRALAVSSPFAEYTPHWMNNSRDL
ncbi:hypothetical protein KCP78_08795 [Salmonella enterica subsp. enterica]|nr:hypothetical protein KCP78_08795 [Salmonella enterica subsp. enterica]